MLNTYTHHCNGTCGERLDQQQKTIKAKNLYISNQSVALDKASRRIAELEKKEEAFDRFLDDIKDYYSGNPLDANLHDIVAKNYFEWRARNG